MLASPANAATSAASTDAAASASEIRRDLWRAPALALMTLCLGFGITVLLWQYAREVSREGAMQRFEYRMGRIVTDLHHQLSAHETQLRTLSGVAGSVGREQWRTFLDAVQNGSRSPGALWVGFAPRVLEAHRDTHEQQTRGVVQGYAVQASEPRAEYFPLAYLRPLRDLEARPVGVDLQEDPSARSALKRAADLGVGTLAGPLNATAGVRRGRAVWALVVPVYAGGATPHTAAERQGALAGYLVEAFDVPQVAGNAIGLDRGVVGLSIHDQAGSVFLPPDMQPARAGREEFPLEREIDFAFGGQLWQLKFKALPEFFTRAAPDNSWMILVGGFLVSALTAGLLGVMAGSRARAIALVEDRTGALRTALTQHARDEARLRAVFDHALDAIITIDGRGTMLSFNPAAEHIFGWREDEVVGKNVNMLMPSPDRERHDSYLSNYLEGGKPKIIGIGRLVTGQRKDGSLLPLDLAVSEMLVGEERLFCGIVRDVTERIAAEDALRQSERKLRQERELLEERVAERTEVLTRTNEALQEEINERRRVEAELVAAREQALQAADAKASFLANMSHEIRTPMNAVIGMTALLEDTELDGEQRGYVETIRTSGDALLSTINDILDFSKVESGMLELERRPFEVGACIEEAFDMLAPRAAEKGIDLMYELMDNVPHWLVGDSTRLRQVLVNLLSNAVKFTDHGEVCMTASVLRRDADGVQLRFAVRDTGIGISPAQRDHLFKAFSQADSSTTRKYGGTGLGLAISARLVRLMGGDIRVESEEHKGSVFSFTIQAEVAQNVPTARYRSDHAPELAGKRVLLVDDNPTNLQILRTQCTRWGMDVSCAARGTYALALLEAEGRFDVAVLDLHMPGMDGFQLARAISLQCGPAAPALVLLSSSAARPRDAAVAELFAARLSKPVKHSQLFAVLDEVIHKGRPAAPPPPALRIDSSLAERLPMTILVAEDSAINQKLAIGMLAKFGYSCDIAKDGAEAVAMVQRERYDLVFMDLQMPVMDGLEATRKIIELFPAESRPRIVAMTANALPAHRQMCLDAGMDDYIAKPILPAAVQALIERWAPQQRGLARRVEPAEATLIDDSIIKELAGLDDNGLMLRGLIADYLNEAPSAVGAIKQHLHDAQMPELGRRAHKLAGTSASLGASGIAEVCYRIETQALAGNTEGMPALVDELEMRFARTRTALQKLA